MSYKAKCCNECGDKIERANWGWLPSRRRFCEVCETNFKHLEWMPFAAFGAAFLLAVFSFGNFFRPAEKNLVVSSNPATNLVSDSNRTIAASPNSLANNSNAARTTNDAPQLQPKSAIAGVKPIENGKSAEKPTNIATAAEAEPVYFCGAQTKKGTPCTRRVRGGGRCWQHQGQPAMLSAEKLAAN